MPAEQPTIQAGIDAASTGDTVLVAPGTYSESIDFKGKNITVTSGATDSTGAAGTILQAWKGGAIPVVSLHTNETRAAILNGFTFQNGSGTGVLLNDSSATISNNAFINVTGCAVAVTGSTANPRIAANYISHIQFDPVQEAYCVNGVASGSGIGVGYAYGAEIVGNTIENGDARDAFTFIPSSITATKSTSLLIENNVVRNNASQGAAIYELGVTTVSILQNLIYGNIVQSTIGNGSSGPAVLLTSGNLYETPHTQNLVFGGNTLFGNTSPASPDAPSSQFQLYELDDPGLSVSIENNLFISSDTSAPLGCFYPSTDVFTITFSHNDVFSQGTPQTTPGCAEKGPAVANLGVDPQFLDPGASNFHTQPTSPVVATGDINAPLIPPADLDGKARTVCGTIDMGVYEVRPRPATVVTSSLNSSAGGTPVTFSAFVPGNCNVPTGTVNFMDGATLLGTVNLTGGPTSSTANSANASFTTAALTVGSHNITVYYPGDFNFDASTSAPPLVQVVTGYPTQTTALNIAPNPSKQLLPITFSATVSSTFTNLGGPPTGTISFMAGGAVLATAPVNASGFATATISTLTAGTYVVTAVYNATTTYASSTSAPVTLTVEGKTPTNTTASVTPNPSTYGQPAIFTAHVTPQPGSPGGTSSVPTGTVLFTFCHGATTTATLDATGTASFVSPVPGAIAEPVGSCPFTGTYSGDNAFLASTSAVASYLVNPSISNTNLNAQPSPGYQGQTVTLTATITGVPSPTLNPVTGQPLPPGLTPATGTVQFYSGTAQLGAAPVASGNQAVFTTSFPNVGTYALSAVYSGDANLGPSTSANFSETILPSSFAIAVNPSTITLKAGQSGQVAVLASVIGNFSGTLTLGNGQIPSYGALSFNPATIALANGATASSTVSIATEIVPAGVAALNHPHPISPFRLPIAFATLLALPLALLRGRRRLPTLFLAIAAIGLLLSSTGCTNISFQLHTVAPGTYIIPITATDAATQTTQTANLTLVVTP